MKIKIDEDDIILTGGGLCRMLALRDLRTASYYEKKKRKKNIHTIES